MIALFVHEREQGRFRGSSEGARGSSKGARGSVEGARESSKGAEGSSKGVRHSHLSIFPSQRTVKSVGAWGARH